MDEIYPRNDERHGARPDSSAAHVERTTPVVPPTPSHRPPTFPAKFAGEAVNDLVWVLGRCLLLLWLQRSRCIEPYFVSSPIRSSKILASNLLKLLQQYRTVLADDLEGVVHTCRRLFLGEYLEQDELLKCGLDVVDSAGWSHDRLSSRHARYLHLRAFVLRMSDASLRYTAHMKRFRSLSRYVTDDRRREQYTCRWVYEDASRALHAEGRVDLDTTRELFRQVEQLTLRMRHAYGSTPVDHLLFGATRGVLLCSLLERNYELARASWKDFHERFPDAVSAQLTRDNRLLREMRHAARRDSTWGPTITEIVDALALARKDKFLSVQRRTFLDQELRNWRRLDRGAPAPEEQLPFEEPKEWVLEQAVSPVVLC